MDFSHVGDMDTMAQMMSHVPSVIQKLQAKEDDAIYSEDGEAEIIKFDTVSLLKLILFAHNINLSN